MATPMTAAEWISALVKGGVPFFLDEGWTKHNRNHRGPWGPVNGVMIHHTAGTNSLSLVREGTPDLPGPLAHAHLSKGGRVTLVSHGRTNHAGAGSQAVYDRVVEDLPVRGKPGPDVVDGNACFYGIEIENLGNGRDLYPVAQYDAAVGWATAICRHHGWTADSVIGHKEWTRRKIDPSFDMDRFREDVASGLVDGPEPVPPEPTPGPKPTGPQRPQAYRDVMETDAVPAPHPREADRFWTLETYVKYLAETQNDLLTRIEALRKQMELYRQETRP